jgi:hypothetical protein
MHDADGAFFRSGKAKQLEAFPVRKRGCDGTLPIQCSEARKKDVPQTQANNRTQQPPQVVARGAQHSMQRIAGLPFEQRHVPWSCFTWPMIGSIACRRSNQRRCVLVSVLCFPRSIGCTDDSSLRVDATKPEIDQFGLRLRYTGQFRTGYV